MNQKDCIKLQILQSQIKALININDKICDQFDLSREGLYEVMHFQQSINEQLDKYKAELDAFDAYKEDCVKFLNLTQTKNQ